MFPGGKNLLHPSGTTFCIGKCAPRAIFWHFLVKFLKKRPAVVIVWWPDILQTLGISIFISKEHPKIISDVGESPKTSSAKRAFFFLDLVFFHFFIRNFPVDEPAFFFKNKSENLAGKTACFFSVWSTLMPVSFRIVLWVAHESFQKSVKSKMLKINF